MKVIGGRDEEDFGQVVVEVQIMVVEGIILFRIQDFKQGRRGITTKVHAHLVDFIQTKHRIVAFDFFQTLNDLARQSPDVGSSVTADFSLISYTAQRKTDEVPSGCPRNRAGERRLPHPWRANKAQDGPLDLLHQCLHGQIFQNSLFRLLQSIMIFVQDGRSFIDIQFVFGFVKPREGENPVDVVSDHSCFCTHGRHELEFLEFGAHLGSGFFAQTLMLDAFFKVFKLRLEVVFFPHFFLDGAHLLSQVILPLSLLHLFFDATLDAIFCLNDVDFCPDLTKQHFQPRSDAHRFQQLLLDLQLERHVRRNGVRQPRRRVDGGHSIKNLLGYFFVVLCISLERCAYVPPQRFDLVGFGVPLFKGFGLDQEVLRIGDEIQNITATFPFHKDLDGTVRQSQDLKNIGDRSGSINVRFTGSVCFGLSLGGQDDLFIVAHGLF